MLYTTHVTSHEQGTIADLKQRAASAKHATTPQIIPKITGRPTEEFGKSKLPEPFCVLESGGICAPVAALVGMATTLTGTSIVTVGNPALLSSLLMLSAVSLPAISSAAAWPSTTMLVSTRMASAKRCRRLLILSILFITTASLATPAACANEVLKAVCLSLVKADCDIGRDRVIRTSCVLVEAYVVVQVEAVEAPVVVVYFPAIQSVHRVAPEVRKERVHLLQQRKIAGRQSTQHH
jgi:hypothetical protein